EWHILEQIVSETLNQVEPVISNRSQRMWINVWQQRSCKFWISWLVLIALTAFNCAESAPTVPELNGGLPASTNGVEAAKGNNVAVHGSGVIDGNIDKDVLELENLKPVNSRSMTLVKSHSSVMKSINGQKEIQSETQEEVDKNGKLLARIHQKMEEKDDKSVSKPLTHVRTEVDIPDKNIHKVYEEGPRMMNSNKRKSPFARQEYDENNVEPMMRSGSGVQFSPMDMAEYIFWVGDEKGVTMAIEDFLQEGYMSREEAINYLEEIKFILNYLQSHYAEQVQKDGVSRAEQSHQLRKNLDLVERAKQARSEASELMEVRQQLREQMSKKNIESMESDPLLRSSEAQEALEKFTRFLEAEAEEGRISRSLEKKVLDVLIASLTDTLTEHPELVAVARESLAMGSGNAVTDNMLQQLIMSRAGPDKNDYFSDAAEKARMAMTSGSNSNVRKNQLFMMKEANHSSDQPQVMMKKSAPPQPANQKTSAAVKTR
ncbi:hypothetical protein LSTR_LSTR011551, partial [Laodelphax striatellus]